MTPDSTLPWFSRRMEQATKRAIVTATIDLWASVAVLWEHTPENTRDDMDACVARISDEVILAAFPDDFLRPTHGLHCWRYDRGEVYLWRVSDDPYPEAGFYAARTNGKLPHRLQGVIDPKSDAEIARYIVALELGAGSWRIGGISHERIPDLRVPAGSGVDVALGATRGSTQMFARERAAYRARLRAVREEREARRHRAASKLAAMSPEERKQLRDKIRARRGGDIRNEDSSVPDALEQGVD